MATTSPATYANDTMKRLYTPREHQRRPVRKLEAVVVENREHSDGNYIRVCINELLPMTSGHLKDNPIPLKVQYTDARGREVCVRGTHNNNITCEYFSKDSFRKTPPDVQRGDRVLVWQKADTDHWYWEPTNQDSMYHRKLETVMQSVNADLKDTPDNVKHDAQNIYYQEMSSHNKTWTVSTSKANNEVAEYTIQINAGLGSVVIKDDAGNHIELDTKATKIWMRNACQTEITCIKNDIKVHCNDYYNETIGIDQSSKVDRNRKTEIGNNDTGKVKNNRDWQIQSNDTLKVMGNQKLDVLGNSDTKIIGDSKTSINGNETTETTGDVSGKITGSLTEEVTGEANQSYKAKLNITVESEAVVKSSAKITLEAPEILLKGNTRVEGSLTVTNGLTITGGQTSLQGGAEVRGNMDIQGNNNVSGSLDVAGPVNLSGGRSSSPIEGS